jgi:hypothetical protein
MLVDGLLLQLRSIPVGIRVDQWLRSSYPDLVAGQNDSVRRQLQENAGALAPHIRESMPKKVVKSSACMNAAFALYWSRLLGEPHQWIPYQALGYESDAEALLSLMDVVPHGPEHDCTLIDQWAQKLALNGCYEWARYHA